MSEGIAGFRLVDPDLKDLESIVTRLNMIDYRFASFLFAYLWHFILVFLLLSSLMGCSDGMALFYKAKSMEQDVERASQVSPRLFFLPLFSTLSYHLATSFPSNLS